MSDPSPEDNKSLCRPLFLWLAIVTAVIIFSFKVLPKIMTPSLLDRIKSEGKLIVATRNSPSTYYVESDDPAGLEFELAEMFAEELGVELRMFEPPSFNDLLNDLQDGKVHIAAAGLTITKEREKIFTFGPPYQEITEQLVYNIASKRPRNISQLGDGNLEVVANSSHEETLKRLQEEYPGLSWKSNDEQDSEELLGLVSDKLIDYTIADSNTLALIQRHYINLRAAFDVSEPRQLAWALQKSEDHSLLREVQKFFNKLKDNGELARIVDRNYSHVETFDYVGTKIYRRHIQTRLPAFREFFEQAAAESELDWRLIAAIGYQESHWNPDAVSPTGVRGIMMLTRKTARDMGVTNRVDPEQSIHGGAKYYKQIKERVDKNIPEPDRTLMALAAYNVGFGHVQDAREITSKLNNNPNSWVDVKQSLPLLAEKKWYKDTRYGYARGHEPVPYVENIRSYYEILKWEDEKNIQDTPVPDAYQRIPNPL